MKAFGYDAAFGTSETVAAYISGTMNRVRYISGGRRVGMLHAMEQFAREAEFLGESWQRLTRQPDGTMRIERADVFRVGSL